VTSPFGPLVVIANPRAGRGKVDAALTRVERVLRDEGLDYRIVRTTHPGHATEAARHALQNGERYLVAVGGDGTVHEVVNGMIQNGTPIASDTVLGVVAAGSGCDRNIAELQAGRIRLDADRPFPVEADGEMMGTTPVSFGIIPGVIRLKV
jgi:diacylglycerol kinase family enzyme